MNKYIYKTILTLSFIIIGITNTYAQSFLRYSMKDGSYCGFYTSTIQDITHKIENNIPVSIIQTFKQEYKIPVNDIQDISFESASLDTGDVGEYKIYLIKSDNNSDTFFKEIYIDNRAGCIASKNGDFGANDIIMYMSAYNNSKIIIHTDSQERINMFFNGSVYLRFVYNDDGTIDMIDLSNNHCVSISNMGAKTKGITSVSKFLKFPKFTQQMKESAAIDYLETNASEWLSLDLNLFQQLTDALTQIESNPELHNQRLLLNSISLVGDLVGLSLSIGSLAASGGLTLPLVALQVYHIYDDFNNLLTSIKPTEEQLKTYKDFYAKKYDLEIQTLPAEEITTTSATLRGKGYYEKEFTGGLSFDLKPFMQEEKTISAYTTKYAVNSYNIYGNADGLEPGREYSYVVKYNCTIDGIHLEYIGERQIFTTRVPSAVTNEVLNVTSNSATVKCTFSDTDGCTSGVAYYETYGDNTIRKATVSGNGKKEVTLSGLKPNTEYTCYAFAEVAGETYGGESKTFRTKSIPIPDLSGTWVFNQNHFGEKSLTINLVYISSTGDGAEYKATGFYGVNTLYLSVLSNGEASISCTSPYGYGADFSGTFDSGFTSISGSSYIYINPNLGPYEVNESWSLSR